MEHIRTSALHGLARCDTDSPALRAVLAARLADPHVDARLEAAAALALRGDARGTATLEEIRAGLRNHRSPGAGRREDLHYQLRARTSGARAAPVHERMPVRERMPVSGRHPGPVPGPCAVPVRERMPVHEQRRCVSSAGA
ncbi:hypothetical protein BX285_4626 [Streptomyces sp. 1114.5]|uniref:hypothetical protein n=1 Tax=Streptomyces sp. 1114.5 TaxID=1938830 RepID=UPI000EAC5CFF|nr:hypothetical protein [Streptomyces sp. 1114.5]RKT20145.1 hypothetical protein BX285_4626 [Streptomyces sp. 1114.5]